MTFDSAGKLYIAVGGPGAIYRVNPANPDTKPELFFKTDEQHIRALAWDAKGNLIAGSDGSGLVYRISPQGKGYVLFEAPRREITSVAVGPDGTIFAASVGDKSHNPLPPLPVQGVGTITFTIVQPGSLQAANASTSTPEGTEVYALAEDQAPRKIWSSKDDIVYALDAQPDGVLAISGNRGHIFRIQKNGDYADIAHVEAQQGLSLANVHGRPAMPSSSAPETPANSTRSAKSANPRVRQRRARCRSFRAIRPRRSRTRLQPTTKSSPAPAMSSSLSAAVETGAGPNGSHSKTAPSQSPCRPIPAMESNPARRRQTRQRRRELSSRQCRTRDRRSRRRTRRASQSAELQRNQQQNVNISFPSANQPDRRSRRHRRRQHSLQAIKDRTAVTVRWAAHDENGDDLVYSLYLRGDGEHDWHLLKDNITEKAYSFDAALIPDGGYRIKVVASDAPSHNPGEALTDSKESDRFEIDTTPPVVSASACGRSTGQMRAGALPRARCT